MIDGAGAPPAAADPSSPSRRGRRVVAGLLSEYGMIYFLDPSRVRMHAAAGAAGDGDLRRAGRWSRYCRGWCSAARGGIPPL